MSRTARSTGCRDKPARASAPPAYENTRKPSASSAIDTEARMLRSSSTRAIVSDNGVLSVAALATPGERTAERRLVRRRRRQPSLLPANYSGVYEAATLLTSWARIFVALRHAAAGDFRRWGARQVGLLREQLQVFEDRVRCTTCRAVWLDPRHHRHRLLAERPPQSTALTRRMPPGSPRSRRRRGANCGERR